jgi:hypothetical protein
MGSASAAGRHHDRALRDLYDRGADRSGAVTGHYWACSLVPAYGVDLVNIRLARYADTDS